MLSKAAGIFYSDYMRAYEGIYELKADEFSFSSWGVYEGSHFKLKGVF